MAEDGWGSPADAEGAGGCQQVALPLGELSPQPLPLLLLVVADPADAEGLPGAAERSTSRPRAI